MFVYRNQNGFWKRQESKWNIYPLYKRFIHSLALSYNGHTCVVGLCDRGDDGDSNGDGNLYIYHQTNRNSWHEHETVTVQDKTDKSLFGIVVSISLNGNTILACGSADNNETGSCWVFARPNANNRFVQQGSKYQQAQNCSAPCLRYYFGKSAQLLGDASAFILGGYEWRPKSGSDILNFGGGAAIYYREALIEDEEEEKQQA